MQQPNEDEIKNETNDEAVERAVRMLFDSIPTDMCAFNVLIALNRLSAEWAQSLHETTHGEGEDDDNEENFYGNLPGTSFGKN
jgi:hypothetical protein